MSKFTKSTLRTNVMATGSHFFDRSSMAFFGDSMANFGLRKAIVVVSEEYSNGLILSGQREVWELYRKHAVKYKHQSSHYFDMATYKQVIVVKE